MKEHIYTIPVTDGFTQGGECPFCNMYHKLDKDSVDYMLGASYMEDDIRAETDEAGFCNRHYEALFAGQNRLGLALMVFTHMQKINSDLNAACRDAIPEPKSGFFSRLKNDEQNGGKLVSYLNRLGQGCYICKRVDTFFSYYMNTYFYLWKQGGDIVRLTKESQGFCLPHFSILVSQAASSLDQTEYKQFLETVIPLQKEQLARVSGELDWFIKKFDYRYSEEPWNNSKDSLPRAIQKISGITKELS